MSKKNIATKEFSVVVPEEPKPLFEISRPSSADCADVCRKLQWFSKSNKRLYIYSVFALVLLAFVVYYIFAGEALMYCIAGAALVFVDYILFKGADIFANGMKGDEDEEAHMLHITFGEESFAVSFGIDMETLPYKSITAITVKDAYFYLSLKDTKCFATGIVFRKDSFEQGKHEEFVSTVNAKIKEA